MKGSEPEWTNPKSSTGNSLKCKGKYVNTMHSIRACGQNIESPLAPETHFIRTFEWVGVNRGFEGQTTLALRPSIIRKCRVVMVVLGVTIESCNVNCKIEILSRCHLSEFTSLSPFLNSSLPPLSSQALLICTRR